MPLTKRLLRCAAPFAVMAVAWAQAANAGDWTIRTSLLEKLSFNDNIDLVNDPDGYVFGSYSNLSLDADYRSHRDEFNLGGSLGYQAYTGTGNDIPSDQWLPSVHTSYLRKSKTVDFNIAASYVVVPATETDDPLIPFDQPEATRQTFSVNSSIAYRVNARNDLNFALAAVRNDFIDATVDDIPNTSLSATLRWNHRATKRTSFNVTSSVNRISYDPVLLANYEKYLYTLRPGFSTQLSKRFTVNGSAGATVTDSYDTPNKGDRETTIGPSADLNFSYALKTGSIGGGVSYGISPDDNGDLYNSLSFSGSYGYQINDLTNFNLTASYRLSDSDTGGDLANSSLSISPSLSYTLARDWRVSASYIFALSDDESGKAHQNAVYLTLTRDYVLMP